MKTSRREFIKAGAVGATVAASGIPMIGAAGEPARKGRAYKPLDILILGGTGYIGPHMVREALRRGHSVTLFNRGRTNSTLFPDLETIKGDRDNGLDGLTGRQWDAVIDNSGYVPRQVQDSARLLAPNVSRYVFISTVSVYASFEVRNSEESPLATLTDETVEEITGETYGALKALCEKRVTAEYEADRLAILRPTYICGPGDQTDRFSYWPVRAKQGGEMLWPGAPDDLVQIVDVRDLAFFAIDCLDRSITGTFNMVNPLGTYSFGRFLEDCQAVTAADIDPVWIDEQFLTDNDIIGGRDLPVWHGDLADHGFTADRALEAGFQHRPERETVRDLLSWWESLPAERTGKLRAGLSAGKEAELIAAWKARNA